MKVFLLIKFSLLLQYKNRIQFTRYNKYICTKNKTFAETALTNHHLKNVLMTNITEKAEFYGQLFFKTRHSFHYTESSPL